MKLVKILFTVVCLSTFAASAQKMLKPGSSSPTHKNPYELANGD